MTTEMTNEELSRAVAERCGLDLSNCTHVKGQFWREPSGFLTAIPNFAESMDACLAPGGPVEWLREQVTEGLGEAFLVAMLAAIRERTGNPDIGPWDVLRFATPRDYCVAFLAVTEPKP